MLKRMECTSMYTPDIQKSVSFYTSLGMKEIYRDVREIQNREPWIVVGLRFPDGGSDLFLQNNPDIKLTEVEIIVDDVREACRNLTEHFGEVEFYREPFPAGDGHIAVVKVPGETVIVLVGK